MPPEQFLLKVFSGPKEGRGIMTNIRSAHSEQTDESLYVQNADTHRSDTLGASGRLVFDSDSKHHIHGPVPGLIGVQSMPVCGEGESLSGLSGTFSQGDMAAVQNVSQAAGANGISTRGCPIQPLALEAMFAVDCIAQAEPNVPRPPPGPDRRPHF